MSLPNPQKIKEAAFDIFKYKPHEEQQKIHDSNARFKTVVCGRRSGKSYMSAHEIAAKLFNPGYEGWRSWIVAPHFDTTRFVFREVWKIMTGMLKAGHMSQDGLIEARFTDQKRVIRTRWGSELLCKSGDNTDALDGEELDLLVMDECAKTKFVVWNQHLRPTMSTRSGEVIFITTPEGRNWVHDIFKRGNDPNKTDWESFTFTSAANPYGHVRTDMEAARDEMTPETFAQEYEAAFISRKGLVYKTFTRAKHVITRDQLPKVFDDIMVGLDYGFVNPTAILIIGIRDGRYYVLAEHYAKEMFDKDIADVLTSFRKVYAFRYCYADHDAETNAYLLRKRFKMKKAQKEVTAGIEKVAQKMMVRKDGQPSLFVVNSCTDTINELESYSYHEPKDTVNEKEEPVKKDDHACDALRYAIYTRESPKGRIAFCTPARSQLYG